MPSQEEFEELKGRIVELENRLKGEGAAAVAEPELTPEEIKAFLKVRDRLGADWGENCGINECFRPPVLRCISRCVVTCFACHPVCAECTCGPCIMSGGGVGGVSRFGALGG